MSKKDKFNWKDGDLNISQCIFCEYASKQDDTCKAFPKGIPMEIQLNRVSHKKPYKGDHGIQFKEIKK